ncbi:MAG: DUF4197 domain-containing protein [Crocinitomicaceae bacterium]|nr:DUF4197 domain-containing protein [Flavobacteriales bacterium]NQZ34904.1 DUF4197 domain-containing protein [Crocinitomicaceae bacterium]PHR28704.1 MAG: hypothetical protein COA38_11970 [Fluviicola sp.]
MKKIIIPIGICASLILSSCDVLNEVAGVVLDGTETADNSKPSLTNGEVISGLKEALNVGIKNSVNLTSVTDGFLANADIRLPFPADAMKVREKALEWGLDGQVEKFETALNRAAEEATKEALPIFKNAILGMSISDGFSILNGGDGAATNFLKGKTTAELVAAFAPKVKAAIATVKLTDYWEPIVNKYNTFANLPLTDAEPVNPDLNEYVTERAIAGLFHMVEIEENKIRKDPMARVTDILQKVFGSLGGN